MAHGLDVCEISMTIPFDPTEPWLVSVIGSEPDTAVEMMAHIALTSLCEKPPCCYSSTAYLSRFRIRRIPFGSNALRSCLTSRVLTSMLG
jgi:hypothetical protein